MVSSTQSHLPTSAPCKVFLLWYNQGCLRSHRLPWGCGLHSTLQDTKWILALWDIASQSHIVNVWKAGDSSQAHLTSLPLPCASQWHSALGKSWQCYDFDMAWSCLPWPHVLDSNACYEGGENLIWLWCFRNGAFKKGWQLNESLGVEPDDQTLVAF